MKYFWAILFLGLGLALYGQQINLSPGQLKQTTFIGNSDGLIAETGMVSGARSTRLITTSNLLESLAAGSNWASHVSGGSQTPLVQDVNGASHTISNAAFSGAFLGLPLAIETSTNLDRISRLFQKLNTMNTAQTNFTIFGFGDSVSIPDQSPQNSIYNHLSAMFGPLSANQDDYMYGYSMAMRAGTNATYVVGPDLNWYSDYLSIPSPGSGLFTNAYGSGLFHDCRGADFFWTANSQGGTFTIQSDGGTGFTNLVTVSGFAATQQETYTNVLVFSGNVVNCRFQIVSITGTNLVTLCLPQFGLAGSQNRVRMIYGGKGGINIGNGLGTFMGVDSNILWSAVNLMHPDVIMWQAKHEASWSGAYSTNFPYLMNLFRSAAPQAETLLFGSYPATTDASQALCTPILKQYATTSSVPCAFIDLAANAPDTNYAQANLWFVEGASPGLHYTVPSYDAILAPYFKYWGLNQSSNGAVVIPNLHIGQGALVNDPDRPFRALTPSGGSIFSLYFLPSSPGVYFDIDGGFSQEYSPNGTITYPTRGAPIRWAQNASTLSSTLWGQFTTNGGFYVGTNYSSQTATRGQVMADNAFLGSSGLSLDVSHSGFGVLSGGLSMNGAETNAAITGPAILGIDANGKRAAVTVGSGLTLSAVPGTLTATGGGGGSATNAIGNLNGAGTNTTIFYSFSVTNNFDGSYFFIDTTNNAWGFIQTNGNKWVYTNGVQFGVGTNTLWASNVVATGWIAASNAVYASSFQGTVGVSNLAGTISAANMPAFSGVVTTSAGSTVTSFGSFSSATLKAALTDYNLWWATNLNYNMALSNVTAHSYLGNNSGSAGYATAITTLDTSLFPALTGDITTPGGSLATTLKNTGTAGTYRSATFDAQGRETSGSNPTTFAGYGLSDSSANLKAALTDYNGNFWTNLNYGALTGGVMVATFDGSYLWPGDTLPATWTTNTPSLSSIAIQSAGPSIKAWSISQSATNQWLLQWRIPEEWDGQPVTPVITIISGTNSVPANALTNTWGCSAALVGTALGTAQLLTNKLPAVTGGLSKTNWDFPAVTIAGSPLPGDYVQFQFQSRAGVTPWSTTNLELLAAVAIRYTATNAQNNAIQRP